MDLLMMDLLKKRRTIKVTVLFRKGSTWADTEVRRLVNGLTASASQDPAQFEYLLLHGHYTKVQIEKLLANGINFTLTQVEGADKLPFNPGWTV